MPLITTRVDDELKRRMDRIPINWSDAIRAAISRIIGEASLRNRVRAGQLTDRIRIRSPAGFDSTKVIRRWRDALYGSRGRR